MVKRTYLNRLNALRTAAPVLAGFDAFVDFGGHLQVLAGLQHITAPAARTAALMAAAEQLGVRVQSMASGRRPRKVDHWLHLPQFRGGTVIVSVQVCECHDGLEATLGHFQDREQVIAEATGRALRTIVPAGLLPVIAAAELVIDTEGVFR